LKLFFSHNEKIYLRNLIQKSPQKKVRRKFGVNLKIVVTLHPEKIDLEPTDKKV